MSDIAAPVTPVLTPVLTDEEFALFQTLIYREAGIHLSPMKKALLVSRLGKRLRELGLRSFAAYHRIVREDRGGELVRMLDAICTNETHFFREPRQFAHIESTIVPAWRADAEAGRRAKSIRVWSAACSTGEEPYSIAMLLAHCFADDPQWRIEILASDLSTRVLQQAREGVWPIQRAKHIPEHLLKAYMMRGRRTQEGLMKAKPGLRSLIDFARVNLNDPSPAVTGRFDLIFCRNVLIYFDDASKARVLDRLLAHLAPSGFIFLGHAESLSRWTDRVRSVGPTIYAPLQGGF
ncbi:MAG TPA: protein-glutamate O-methyltransferase CheR [Thermoanaerobaculia bacterium]|nr:protein-glutamate O-methyltransferase CheR [Thermoanaerobaculia bacterium]